MMGAPAQNAKSGCIRSPLLDRLRRGVQLPRVPIIDLHGHTALRQRLADAVTRGTLPASLLLTGPRGVGKQRIALWLGRLLLCNSASPRPCGSCQSCRFTAEVTHPDLHWVFPRPRLKDSDPDLGDVRRDYAEAIAERVEQHGLYAAPSGSEGIYIVTVRAIVQTAAMSPAVASRKVIVVGDADRMVPQESSPDAANAFLKLLEEPPADTNIILTSSEPGALLPTIRSRVVTLRVAPLTEGEMREFAADEQVAARLREADGKESPAELLRMAAGAPGRMLSSAGWRAASTQAKRLLEAATGADRATRYRASLMQGGAGARGAFSDTLDALTLLLRDRVHDAVLRSDEAGALGASRAVEAVERAKEQASGNVSPQLIGAALLSEIGGYLA